MKVLMVEPGKAPYETEIEGGLESLQKAVGGSIQAVYPYDDPVALICNEEGKLMGLPLNRSLTDDNGEIYDIIAGNFILTGLTEDNFGDLKSWVMSISASLASSASFPSWENFICRACEVRWVS